MFKFPPSFFSIHQTLLNILSAKDDNDDHHDDDDIDDNVGLKVFCLITYWSWVQALLFYSFFFLSTSTPIEGAYVQFQYKNLFIYFFFGPNKPKFIELCGSLLLFFLSV